jgi:hypothetical protein
VGRGTTRALPGHVCIMQIIGQLQGTSASMGRIGSVLRPPGDRADWSILAAVLLLAWMLMVGVRVAGAYCCMPPAGMWYPEALWPDKPGPDPLKQESPPVGLLLVVLLCRAPWGPVSCCRWLLLQSRPTA